MIKINMLITASLQVHEHSNCSSSPICRAKNNDYQHIHSFYGNNNHFTALLKDNPDEIGKRIDTLISHYYQYNNNNNRYIYRAPYVPTESYRGAGDVSVRWSGDSY